METALICTGVLLLALAGIGTQRRWFGHPISSVRQLLNLEQFLRHVFRRLHDMPLPQEDGPIQALRLELQHLQQRVKCLASLPGGARGLPRILTLARALNEENVVSPETMQAALTNPQCDWTPAEISTFPLALGFAEAELLHEEMHAYCAGQVEAAELSTQLWHHAEYFSKLRQMFWLEEGEQADPLHALLLEDPSGTYPDMTATSRLALRLDAERFARQLHLSANHFVKHALILSQAAGQQTLEAYVGYWLQDAHGMAQLRHSLGVRAGWLYVHLAPRVELRRYLLRCLMGSIAGFAFLQTGHPVFMLPFFLLCAGTVVSQVLRLFPEAPLPSMISESGEKPFRTLIVLPVQLQTPHDSIRQIKRLSKIGRICGQENMDFLLLDDPPAHITAVSGQDGVIAAAALEALTAQSDRRFLYMQRGRTWSDTTHIYTCRGGTCGALQEVCRLIVRGETLDPITYFNMDLADLERRYAYMLVLPEHTLPDSDMLEKLLGAAAHPMNVRYPDRGYWRGYAVLSPENYDASDGCWLLRPDAFLEATEDRTNAAPNEELLCIELAGHAAVHGAYAGIQSTASSWTASIQRAANAWLLLPWQLPWVKATAGIIRNPLEFFARFRLRDRLRSTSLPAAQFVLLLWALLTNSWLLLLLALLLPTASPLSGDARQSRFKLLSLPTQAAVSVIGILWPWIARLRKLPPEYVLELWSQWIAAAILIGLAIALPWMQLPSLMLAAGFAAYPLLHQKQS